MTLLMRRFSRPTIEMCRSNHKHSCVWMRTVIARIYTMHSCMHIAIIAIIWNISRISAWRECVASIPWSSEIFFSVLCQFHSGFAFCSSCCRVLVSFSVFLSFSFVWLVVAGPRYISFFLTLCLARAQFYFITWTVFHLSCNLLVSTMCVCVCAYVYFRKFIYW